MREEGRVGQAHEGGTGEAGKPGGDHAGSVAIWKEEVSFNEQLQRDYF